ncbi:hypothetical protein ASB1_05020 [Helicobacter heilmannii]|uniref:hypothetical protein n=1 Tax=Helicobacter heilmannii TaxID=35817 RepID=UPI0022043A35|nr:hypothetical protein [Helicobacter heilmannii]BDQ26826.1 hypothetical protein ASB1_05020 [Helicobacter heilmannii]
MKEGIDALFATKPELARDIKELYNTTLKDYAHMKEALKMAKQFGLRDVGRAKEAVADGLIKAIKGQGEGGVGNLDRMHLNPSQREAAELHILNRLFTKSLYDEEALKVFDSQDFFKRVQQIGENTFQSQAAKDFLDMASGFNRLFRNDAKIAKMLAPARTERIGASIATSVSGAFQHQITKELFAFLTRLVPHIPFATRINEKVSGEVLTHAIKQALLKSHTIQDFNKNIQARAITARFDNSTKRLIKAWTEELEQGVEQIGSRAAPKTIEQEQALKILENPPKAEIPQELDVQGFLKSLEEVENKDNFITHLSKKQDAQSRLAYLNLVEPTLKEWDLKLVRGERSEYIKSFSDGNGGFFSLLITQEGDKRLITFIPKTRLKFLQDKVKSADLIQTFTGRAGDGVWPRIDNSTTPSLKSDLSAQEIKEAVKKWDLAHPKETDALNFALVKGLELTELKEVFKADKLLRQLRSTEVKESLDKGFSLEEVLNYTRHLPTSQRNIIGDELHYSKALENGKSLKIVETYQAP